MGHVHRPGACSTGRACAYRPHRQPRRAQAARRHALRADPARTGPTRIVSALSADLAAAFAASGLRCKRPAPVPRHASMFSTSRRAASASSSRCSRNSIGRAAPARRSSSSGQRAREGARRLSARAGHARERPAPRRRQPRPGGLTGQAELTRHRGGGSRREAQLLTVDLGAVLARRCRPATCRCSLSTTSSSRKCRSGRSRRRSTLVGEVRFPGNYPIRRGETLRGSCSAPAASRTRIPARHRLHARGPEGARTAPARSARGALQRDIASLTLQQAQSGEAGHRPGHGGGPAAAVGTEEHGSRRAGSSSTWTMS